MRNPFRNPLILVLASLCLAGSLARADAFKYPESSSVLSVTLPDHWVVTERTGPAHLLLCAPPGDTTFTINLISLPTVGSKADLKDILGQITRAGATGAGLTNVTVSDATEGPIGDGPRQFTKVTATGQASGEEGAYTYYAFSLPGTGRYYAVGVAGLQVMIDAHRAEFEAVAKSIEPIH